LKDKDRKTAEGILFTDQYQFTMAQVYYRAGMHNLEAQFDHFFRNYPDYGIHKAGYCINAGLQWFVDWIEEVTVRDEDIEYLGSQKNRSGKPIFGKDFLSWLKREFDLFRLSMRAIPEGRVVHRNVPLTVVRGPLAIAQILETSLLNHLNFQTLIATKAARIHESGRGQLMLEFGLRRAHNRGGNAGARAALIGGADFSSNVGISHVLGYPPKGTHAHSMIQAFITLGYEEIDAFRAYADIYPDDCILLVDTINTLESGVPNAIKVFEELRRKGHKPVGVRLDSGDLAYLSIQVAKMLNEAGFPETSIVLSNNLDELIIWQIITQIEEEAPRYGLGVDHILKRLTYGVGTRLITSHGASSLGGVYKLVALKKNNNWEPAIKISETPEKTPNPGHKNVWRLYDRRGKATADLLCLEQEDPRNMKKIVLRKPIDCTTKGRVLNREDVSEIEPLLIDVMKDGKRVYELPGIEELREQRKADIEHLDPGIRRLMNPHIYHVSLSKKLCAMKVALIRSVVRNGNENNDVDVTI
jgi:nicotinate phosphoribosyltransferase